MFQIWSIYNPICSLYQEEHKKTGNNMTYEIKLLEADIRNPMDGSMTLGLHHEDTLCGTLEYSWDDKMFSSVFHGNAPSLPVPAHPTMLLQRAIAAIYALKTADHAVLTDVFRDHVITINVEK
jgi:hypothetical protein